MKKIGLVLIGIIAAVILLSNLGSLLGMILSVGVLYLAIKKFIKADTTTGKVTWGLIGFIGLSTAVANMPAILGIIAIYILYIVYKKWNGLDEKKDDNDPFTHFEKQWDELKKS
ncbi:flagellar basal body rod protein [Alkalihalobacillus macyae]|uniref:lmo0954 family membrane protein n=1 Tax=Guptibacillus hwajinpoensis TaxID=208199 RepID=UPI00273C432F|nr:flagellar basal body rod protein [Alkalihalobacillus macyae]MDP4552228.1 flagellar basal body rod protein [Alkalihalobacillus macyae]